MLVLATPLLVTAAHAGEWSLSFVNSNYNSLSSIKLKPGIESPTYYVQSNLNGSYQKVATRTAITFSSTDPRAKIYTYAKKTDWYSLENPVTTNQIATSSGRRSFKLLLPEVGTFTLTAEAPGYDPVSIEVNSSVPLPPPPPPPSPPPPPPSSPKPIPVKPVVTEPAPSVTPPAPVEVAPPVTEEVQAIADEDLEPEVLAKVDSAATLRNPWSDIEESHLSDLVDWLRPLLPFNLFL